MKRLLVADDHAMFSDALSYLLRAQDPAIEVVPVNSIAEVEKALQANADFDLLLLDYAMPKLDGLRGLIAIKEHWPSLRVAMISGVEDVRLVRNALDAGAAGWLPKSMSGETLLHALRLMARGERFVPIDLLVGLAEPPASIFTRREQEVAALLIEGLSDKEIAAKLMLEPGTVKVHVKNILRKSGSPNRRKFAAAHRSRE